MTIKHILLSCECVSGEKGQNQGALFFANCLAIDCPGFHTEMVSPQAGKIGNKIHKTVHGLHVNAGEVVDNRERS